MFKKMTDTEILNYIEKELEKDIKFSQKAIKDWLDFKKNKLLKNIHSKDLEKFSNTLEHLRDCERGIKHHNSRIELLMHYLDIIKDGHKDDPCYLTKLDIKEVCEKCGNFFSDSFNHTLCQNLELRHKCRVYFDNDGNRIKEKLKCK